jgi:hypothetical protein
MRKLLVSTEAVTLRDRGKDLNCHSREPRISHLVKVFSILKLFFARFCDVNRLTCSFLHARCFQTKVRRISVSEAESKASLSVKKKFVLFFSGRR